MHFSIFLIAETNEQWFILQSNWQKFRREKLKREISIFYKRRRHISAERLSWAETKQKLQTESYIKRTLWSFGNYSFVDWKLVRPHSSSTISTVSLFYTLTLLRLLIIHVSYNDAKLRSWKFCNGWASCVNYFYLIWMLTYCQKFAVENSSFSSSETHLSSLNQLYSIICICCKQTG